MNIELWRVGGIEFLFEYGGDIVKLQYDVIYKNITEWDPMDIIFYKDPECTTVLNPDEYEPEIDAIYDKCDYVKKGDIVGLAKVISDVFYEWFDTSLNVKDCLPIAEKIYFESK